MVRDIVGRGAAVPETFVLDRRSTPLRGPRSLSLIDMGACS